MTTYITKKFTSPIDVHIIDIWLNSFYTGRPTGEYNYEVIGYVVLVDEVVITLKIFESRNLV